jgi:ribonuclease HI
MDYPLAEIYTDGACSGNPGPGGWAALIIRDGAIEELSGGEGRTTNQRMELRAAAEALKALAVPSRVRLYSDSAYLVNCFRQGWMERWLKNGWLTAAGKPVENRDLWQEIQAQALRHRVEWHKVKGHGDNKHNERCDRLARRAIIYQGDGSADIYQGDGSADISGKGRQSDSAKGAGGNTRLKENISREPSP